MLPRFALPRIWESNVGQTLCLLTVILCVWGSLLFRHTECFGQERVDPSSESIRRASDTLLAILDELRPKETPQGMLHAEFIDACRLMLDPSPRQRHRFLITDNAAMSRGVSKQIMELLDSPSTATSFRDGLDKLAVAYSEASEIAESARDWDRAYRYARYVSGIRSILPSRENQSKSGTKDWIERVTRSNTNHPKTLWPAGSYSLIITDHFEIASQAPTKQAEEIAEICERAYAVWKQLFVDYWFDASNGTSPLDESAVRKKFSVAIYRDKNAYVKALQATQKNIAISTGYYEPNRKIALFYWDGIKTQPPLIHELVHQFFFEASAKNVELNTDTHPAYWAVEGISLYFESMSFRPLGGSTIVDVGGWDASRFQAARYRRLHDQFWIDWGAFRTANGQQLRRQQDISAWYSQATGLTHLWMDSSNEHRRAFAKYVASIYAGKEIPTTLNDWNDETTLRTAYDRFLLTGPQNEPNRPFFSNRKEAVLSRCDISSERLLAWPEPYRTMAWLDLSFCPIDDAFLLTPSRTNSTAWNIGRLNLESTKITDRSMEPIASMRDLVELDVSGCNISDEGLSKLRGNKHLKTLWLTDCEITDLSIDVLLSMPALEQLNIKGTKITAGGWNKLITSRPRWKNNSTGP